MWLSLLGAVLCVAVMFLISWATALITFCVVLALYLIVAYRKPDVNWGSTTQAQTYKNALMSVQQLNNVEDHVKNYRPQILVLSGLPNTRPVLVDFAYMLTKNLSLLVCGHVLRGSGSQKYRNYLKERASSWFRKHRVKGFYALVDGEDFESGTRALMQASGIGKLKPNIILMGYKTDWQTCERKELVQYFNVMHKVSRTWNALMTVSCQAALFLSLGRHWTCICLWPFCVCRRVWTARSCWARRMAATSIWMCHAHCSRTRALVICRERSTRLAMDSAAALTL